MQNSHPGVPRQDGNYYFCSYFAKDVARSARFGGSAAVSPCYVQSCWLHHQDTTGRLQAYKQHPALLGLAWHAVLGNYLCSHKPSCNGSKTEALDTIKKKKKRGSSLSTSSQFIQTAAITPAQQPKFSQTRLEKHYPSYSAVTWTTASTFPGKTWAEIVK